LYTRAFPVSSFRPDTIAFQAKLKQTQCLETPVAKTEGKMGVSVLIIYRETLQAMQN
jgi:hypothetical protein